MVLLVIKWISKPKHKEALPGAEVERVGEGIKITLGENTVNFDFNSSNSEPLPLRRI